MSAQGDGKPVVNEGPTPDWQGTEPAEGTRRALIRDAILGLYVERNSSLPEICTPEQVLRAELAPFALELADAVESALLKSTIAEEEDRVPIDHPSLANIDARLKEYREEHHEAHALLDVLGIPKGPEISPPTVLNRLKALHEEIKRERAEVEDEVWAIAREGEDGDFYVGIDSLIEHLQELKGGEEFEGITEDDKAVYTSGRRVGRREAMLQILREKAATEEDAELAANDLEEHGKAFLSNEGKHMPADGKTSSPNLIDALFGMLKRG